jgi:hypothetical protein
LIGCEKSVIANATGTNASPLNIIMKMLAASMVAFKKR